MAWKDCQATQGKRLPQTCCARRAGIREKRASRNGWTLQWRDRTLSFLCANFLQLSALREMVDLMAAIIPVAIDLIPAHGFEQGRRD